MSGLRGTSWVLLLVMGLVLAAGPARSGDGASPTSEPDSVISPGTAPGQPVGPVTIEAAGRGGPWVNLTDGRPVPTEFPAGSHAAAQITDRRAQPRSLTAADFDEDGVPDLVCGFATDEGGLITLHRGNIDAIYQDAPEARARRAAGAFVDSPFLPQVDLVEVTTAPDYIAAGDFDADGHWDIAFSAKGGASILVNFGDGTGHFAETETIALPGLVTTMTAGEINRRDGLVDIVVGIDGEDGPRALVFEGPEGALRSAPESIPLPGPAIDLSLEQLDDALYLDLAVATAGGVAIVQGRDRRLTHTEDRRRMVGDPVVRRFDMPFTITAMTTGDFDGDHRTEIALLDGDGSVHVAAPTGLDDVAMGLGVPPRALPLAPATLIPEPADGRRAVRLMSARVSSIGGDDLLIMDRAGRRINLLLPVGENASDARDNAGDHRMASGRRLEPVSFDAAEEPIALLPMRLDRDALSDLVVLSDYGVAPDGGPLSTVGTDATMTFTVTNTNSSGSGSLDQAIIDANSNPGFDLIVFNIAGPGPHSIRPTAMGLTAIFESVTIDATTEPDIVEIDGSDGAYSGINVYSSNTTIRGLVINRFEGFGIWLQDGSNNRVEGSLIGIDASGTIAAQNGFAGMEVVSFNSTIGGTTAAARNVISGNALAGIRVGISGGVVIQGNHIGTNAPGTAAISNAGNGGIHLVNTPSATIGGTVPGAGNLISGNLAQGILVADPSSGNLIQGNLIGTSADGLSPIGNRFGPGIEVTSSTNTIGGTTPAARNIISGGESDGIWIVTSAGIAEDNLVQGNFIGTDISGSVALPNLDGGMVVRGAQNIIGGTTATARNIISGNGGDGISLCCSGHFNSIFANYIGTTVSGFEPLGNEQCGIRISVDADNNQIGGPSPLLNVISANHDDGVCIFGGGSVQNVFEVNYIGVDASGMIALGNHHNGVDMDDAESNWFGIRIGQGNVISGNWEHGVNLENAAGVTLHGNLIGLDVTGNNIVPNGLSGVYIEGGSLNSIGGTMSHFGNIVSGNLAHGIHLLETSFNEVHNNIVGLNPIGAAVAPNLLNGVLIDGGNSNLLGDMSASDLGNTISGNGGSGVLLMNGTTHNTVGGNRIGLDLGGANAVPNGGDGVRIVDSINNWIGGSDGSAGNVISGNAGSGIHITATSPMVGLGDNGIFGNSIGTDGSLSLPRGNGDDGITLSGWSRDNAIGGLGPMQGNLIAYNDRGGIYGLDSSSNWYRGNRIFQNATLGIDLAGDGVTLNDAYDLDFGPNDLLNFPEVTSAVTSAAIPGGAVSITGTLDGIPDATFDIDYFATPSCDPLFGHGEAQSYLGSTTVHTDLSGHTDLFAEFAGMYSSWSITTTASNLSLGTSEFSQCSGAADGPPPAVMGVSWSEDGTTLSWSGMLAAETYSIYEGGPADLPNLLDPDPDSCLLYSGPAPMTTADVQSGNPPLGSMFWQVVRAGDSVSGEGSAGEATAGPRMQDSTGDCQYCAHDKCQLGGPLQETCSPCVATICAQNPTCCTDQWDLRCAMDVLNVCGSFACQPLGTCTHSFCQTGEALQPGCDNPPLQPSCVDRICASFPNCCGGPFSLWTSQCASAVEPLCGLSCD